MQHARSFVRLSAFAAAAFLAACGGGGSGSETSAGGNTNNPPPPQAALTGKAMDGYLARAVICLDLNHNSQCDSGEPSTTTDDQGNYSLPITGDHAGQTLVAVVTPQTVDLSRPKGYQFPAGFTLAATVSDTGAQHISPLSALVTAQLQAGATQAQANAAVQALVGADPTVDYVASGDAATLAKAQAIVDKLVSFADQGAVSGDTVRNVLNAIVAKGDISAVTATDVAAQAATPVYTVANSADVLGTPQYALEGYLDDSTVQHPTGARGIVQNVWSLQSGNLVRQQQEYSVNGWQALAADKYEPMVGAYELKADRTWSGLVTLAQYQAAQPVQAQGARLVGTDAITGINYTYETRRVDLSNQPLATAVQRSVYQIYDLSTRPEFTGTTFGSGTAATVGMLSYAADRVVLPLRHVAGCAETVATNGELCGYPVVAADGVTAMVTGNALTQYTSVQQAIGDPLVFFGGDVSYLRLEANGQATYTTTASVNGVEQRTDHSAGTWSVYAGNSNVIVVELNAEFLTPVRASYDPILSAVNGGAKLAVALHNGHLRLGNLYPAGYAAKAYQFNGTLPEALVTATQAVAANAQ